MNLLAAVAFKRPRKEYLMFLYSIKNVYRNPFYLLLSFIHPSTTDDIKGPISL